MAKKRSIGVMILGWYFILNSISHFLCVFIYALSDISIEKITPSFVKYPPIITACWIGMIFLGRGLLALQEWARKVTIFLFIFLILFFAAVLVFVSIYFMHIIVFVFALIGLYFLTRPKVREQFK